MTAGRLGRQLATLGIVVLGAHLGAHSAQATRHVYGQRHTHSLHAGMMSARSHLRWARFGWSGGLQCVPFARENTGIELSGNAATWWNAAAGIYERGSRPEVGSVLNFRATGRMRMGHVAVVTNVVNSRNVEIDHANWGGPGAVSRDVTVVDVSPANDWSEVRVELGHTGDYGSVYPTYGFIYDRPDRGTLVANTGVTQGVPSSAVETVAAVDDEEVAEAPGEGGTGARAAHRRFSHRARFFGHASVYHVHSRFTAERPRSHGRHV